MKPSPPQIAMPEIARHHRARSHRARAAALSLIMLATAVTVVFGPVQSASALGRPGATTTGVPRGTHLTQYPGNLTITRAGAVYSNLDVRGFVYVRAANVTIKRSIIRGGVARTSTGLVTVKGGSNFVITDSELVPAHPSVYIDGITGSGYTAARVNIHGTVDGAKVTGNNVTIQDSYIHDLVRYQRDPYQKYQPTHNDGVQVLGGRHIRITNNSLSIKTTLKSALQVSQNAGPVSDLQFSYNWADGATCTVNITYKPMRSMAGITVNYNRFGVHTPAACTIVAKPHVGFTAKGNMMDRTSKPARVRILP